MHPVSMEEVTHLSEYHSHVHHLLDRYEQLVNELRLANPDLHRLVEERKRIDSIKKADAQKAAMNKISKEKEEKAEAPVPPFSEPIYFRQFKQKQLKSKILSSQKVIHQQVTANQSVIVPRTQARNIKQPHGSREDMAADRAEKTEAQIKAWRSILPVLISRFRKISDPRRAKSVKHKMAAVMLYGLFAFMFHLSSRREINRELTGTVIFENLKKVFPELETVPHADTLARLLQKTNINEIESAHVLLINKLIRNKKLNKLLISGCLPIALDGTQKLYRDGELQDVRWLNRKVGNPEAAYNQQYVYILEANIVLKNGLTLPLLSEYLKVDWNVLNNPDGKQENELVAFERLAAKLKQYFPRLKIMVFADALFAAQPGLEKLQAYHWQYVVQFSKNKLKDFSVLLNSEKAHAQSVPGQLYYQERQQGFHLLMRLAHVVNALSEFTKKIKQWIREQGCSAILKMIKETFFNPWLPIEWYDKQSKKPVQLKLQLE